jgi:ubiquinone/menaquinone biosynthesis C-methylase UbiE
MKNEAFYDDVSSFYDEMTHFDDALKKRIEIFNSIFNRCELKTIADIGCGSGLDSIALASLGYEATGFDPSAKMLNKARVNANKKGVKAKYKKYSIQNIPKLYNKKFDMAIAFGNVFSNIPQDEIQNSLIRIYDMLKDGGVLFLQILNNDKILKEKQTLIGTKEDERSLIVRYYDYYEDHLLFNILKIDRGEKTKGFLLKTILYPYRKKELLGFLENCGFYKIKIYGDIKLGKYKRDISKDLVVVARKQAANEALTKQKNFFQFQ